MNRRHNQKKGWVTRWKKLRIVPGVLLSCLGHALYRLLFLPNFCIDEARFLQLSAQLQARADAAESAGREGSEKFPLNPGYLWETGVALPGSAYPINARIEGNRVEVLKLMLVCISRQMFTAPEKHPSADDRWLTSITAHLRGVQASSLFFSLLNVVITYDPVGWGILCEQHHD